MTSSRWARRLVLRRSGSRSERRGGAGEMVLAQPRPPQRSASARAARVGDRSDRQRRRDRAAASGHIQTCAAWARHDCFDSRGCSGLAMPLPRPQSSGRGRRTAASARRCGSRVARGWPYPPSYCLSAASAATRGPERSSCRGRSRDRFARDAIAPRQEAGRVLSLWDQPPSQLCSGDLCADGL